MNTYNELDGKEGSVTMEESAGKDRTWTGSQPPPSSVSGNKWGYESDSPVKEESANGMDGLGMPGMSGLSGTEEGCVTTSGSFTATTRFDEEEMTGLPRSSSQDDFNKSPDDKGWNPFADDRVDVQMDMEQKGSRSAFEQQKKSENGPESEAQEKAPELKQVQDRVKAVADNGSLVEPERERGLDEGTRQKYMKQNTGRGEDYWLSVIDDNPQLDYYQAEILLLVGEGRDLPRALRLLERYVQKECPPN